MSYFIKTESIIKDIFRRIKKKDFSGNTGLALKNSIYQFSTDASAKIGSFIFLIILARLLMPEFFGLYSLALSTILIFGGIFELGTSTAVIRFISREFGKKKRKVIPYLYYFGKIKIIMFIFAAILLTFSAKYISNVFYQKPIFFALLAGVLYIMFNHLNDFLKSLLHASNNFASIFKREIIFQISRMILIPLLIIFALKKSFSSEINLMLIILFLAFSLFLASLLMMFDVKKIYFKKFKKEKDKLSKKQKTNVNKFLFATATLSISGIFFGNIDKVMLGRFVQSEFIGYYTAAFGIVGAMISLIGFSSIVLLPIFSKLKGKRLEKGLQKSIIINAFLSIILFIITISLSYLIIQIVYGNQYLLATNILRILSLLLFIAPLIAIYQSYYVSQGKLRIIAKFLILTTLFNVILNYILIKTFIPYGDLFAVYGVVFATLFSQGIYLGGLFLGRKIKYNKKYAKFKKDNSLEKNAKI